MEAVMEKIGIGKYSSYKDSGVEWVGIIPQHWNIKPIRAVFQERNEKNTGPKTDFILSVTRDRGVIPYDEKGNIGNNKSEDIERYKVVYPNDLVINKMNVIIGSLGLSKYHGALSQVYIVLQPRTDEFSINYYSYLFSNESFYKSLIRYCTGIMELRESLNKEEFKKLPLPLPPIEEQTAIADFLDRKTAQIDKAIAQKEKLIELLKERRQILIHKAVTRGLDPNVQMKDSGVEWIGEIPEHWEVKRLKHISNLITSGPRGWSNFFSDDGAYFLQSGNLNETLGIDLENAVRVSPKSGAEGIRTRLKDGDVLVVVTGAKTGKVAISKIGSNEVYINQHLCLVRLNSDVNSDFISIMLHSKIGRAYFDLQQYGLKEGLGLDDVKNAQVVLPSIEEQTHIVTYIEAITAKITQGISLKSKEIRKLKEYKATLINAAVTGKIKVG